jgi:hypothetical protein
MMNTLLEYYRCPAEFSCLEVLGEPSPNPGFFRFEGTTLFGRLSFGMPAEAVESPLDEIANYSEVRDSKCYLPFDADEVVTNLREERYAAKRHRRHVGSAGRGLARRAYYFVRPFLGVGVRKHLQRISLRDSEEIQFPSWPVDRTVDRTFEKLMLLIMKARGIQSIPFIWFWPEGKSGCAMMTHDVETTRGLEFCSQLMDLDDSYEIKSSFQIIPAGRYTVSRELLAEIRQRNFEVNVHDWNHDGLLYSDRRVFLERAEGINKAAESYGAEGFRSGVLYRNTNWYDSFRVAYDMSIPNVGHLDPQVGGCCTVMPYFIGRILEIPVTTIQDYSLFHIRGDYSIDLWQRQLELVLESNGLASFIVHPDYVIDKRARATYGQLLQYLAGMRAQRNVWIARPHEVNRWWRERNQMKLIQRAGKWEIDGVGKERACVGYAQRNGQGIAYSLHHDEAEESLKMTTTEKPAPLVVYSR